MAISAKLFNIEMAWRAWQAIRANRARRDLAGRGGPTDVLLCIVDHYEPQVGQPTREVAQARVLDWTERYPKISDAHRDADGRQPRHSFFYPWDEYDAWELERLAELCGAGYGEIELHLHHRDDTEATLRPKFRDAIKTYAAAGALSRWPDGRPAFAFIHGNWALDNSRTDGGRNYCGVNNEIQILREEGCYADFTFPAWGHAAQPRQVNALYHATDDPNLPKSYDTGIAMRAGTKASGDLPMIQGPLVPHLKRSGKFPRPAIDDGDLASYRRYAPARLDRWIGAAIHVEGRPDRIFIKLHTHGAADFNRAALLGEDLAALFTDAEARYNDGVNYRLHYVTAREMFNVALATQEAGGLDIATARDYLLKPPPMQTPSSPLSNRRRAPHSPSSK